MFFNYSYPWTKLLTTICLILFETKMSHLTVICEKKLKWNFWRGKCSPRLIHYSQMISLSFSLYLFLFWRILYRRENEKLCSKLSWVEPNWNNRMVMVRLLLELKYVGLAEVAVAPDLIKTHTITSDYLIETLLKNFSLQGFSFSDFR